MENQKCTVISIVNQKGGVGKTTTSINLSGELASRGYKTLIIDFDPQGDASRGLGYDIDKTSLDMVSKFLLIDEQPYDIEDIITQTSIENLSIITTSDQNLARTLQMIESDKRRRSDLRLKKSIKNILDMFDFIIIDCSPTDTMLSTNALVASDYTIIPVKYDKYSLSGIGKLYEKIEFIQEESNEKLEILSILPTMYMASSMMKAVDVAARESDAPFSKYISSIKIRQNTKASEAPFSDVPLNLYDNKSNAARDYNRFTDEILTKMKMELRKEI